VSAETVTFAPVGEVTDASSSEAELTHDTQPPSADGTRPRLDAPNSRQSDAPRRFGDYDLLEVLGQGGMGIVYRARQRSANRIVALKVIRADRLANPSPDHQAAAFARFKLEAQTAAQLDHDHLVTVFEVGQCDQQPFYSMKYVDGCSLSELLRDGPLENRRAAGYLEAAARGVHEAHEHGILHRDLKPHNILIETKTDRALVADFGLAKLAEADGAMTVAGEVFGTPSYMPPEQAVDSSRVTTLSDVYSLGATLYHALTGRPPFLAATTLETLKQVVEQEPVRPRELNASVDRDLETICLKALHKEPRRRYASAAEFADDLRRYSVDEPIRARRVRRIERGWRWCRRNPIVATLLCVVVISATVIFVSQSGVALHLAIQAMNEARKARADMMEMQIREALKSYHNELSPVGERESHEHPM
jgi:serine/threonine protein kinase